ncbi:MAG: response regulator, partial [Gammaproteobacteria bacterium]|nr:response regulator [Gammaproteobacteria bacterium]
DRRVRVSYRRNSASITFLICDEGNGFDWQGFLEIDPARGSHNHGRGIALAKIISFSKIEYLGRGNQVRATVAHSE